MNEYGLFLDYHKKEFDYYRTPVKRELYIPIPSSFRKDFCSAYWLLAVSSVGLDLPDRSVDVARSPLGQRRSVRAVLEGCRLSLASVLGSVANVDDLFALMAVEASVVWPAISEVNRSGKRPGVERVRATSRMDLGGNFVCFNP
eukprot:IDg7125t1